MQSVCKLICNIGRLCCIYICNTRPRGTLNGRKKRLGKAERQNALVRAGTEKYEDVVLRDHGRIWEERERKPSALGGSNRAKQADSKAKKQKKKTDWYTRASNKIVTLFTQGRRQLRFNIVGALSSQL